MAAASPSADESVFDFMTEQITTVFDRIIKEVTTRRDLLLLEVSEKRKEFELRNSAMIDNVRELEEMRSHFEKMSIKQNLALRKQQESLAEIDSEIDKLRTDMYRSTQLKYSCSSDQLIQLVKQFGEIIDPTNIQAIYSKKLTAAKVIEGLGKQIRFHVDSYKELLYLISSERSTVFVCNINDLEFVKEFGDTNYPPSFVAASREFIYIASTNDRILRYKSTDYSFAGVIGCYYEIIGIAVSDVNQVFVIVQNSQIRIYDRALNLKEEIKLDLKKFGESNENITIISMFLREDRIYLLSDNKVLLVISVGDWKNIDFYFKKEEGNSIIQLILSYLFYLLYLGKIPNLENTRAFCIDQMGNVIISDYATKSLKFFSPEGDPIHTIGENTVGSDSIAWCSGIAVYKNSIIVACRDHFGKGYHIRLY